jgi:prepilin-type N-terminal cleavage/methylation domain-containing protein
MEKISQVGIIMTALRSRKGITLIELMVTIAIMGFLVTVALPNIFGVAEKTREKVDLLKLYYLRDALNRALIEDLDAFQNFSQTTNDKSRADIINTLDQGLKDQKRGATLFVIELHNGLSINVQGEHGSANNAYNICRIIGNKGTWYDALNEARFEGVADIIAARLPHQRNTYDENSTTYSTIPYVNPDGKIDHRTAPRNPIFISKALTIGKESANTRYTMSIHWAPGSEGYSVEVYLLPHKNNPQKDDWQRAYRSDHGVCFSTLGNKGCKNSN